MVTSGKFMAISIRVCFFEASLFVSLISETHNTFKTSIAEWTENPWEGQNSKRLKL